jgi:hypothetical protein
MRMREALTFIAALSRRNDHWRDIWDDNLGPGEADELMDEVDASEELRGIVVATAIWMNVWDQPYSRIALINEIAREVKK